MTEKALKHGDLSRKTNTAQCPGNELLRGNENIMHVCISSMNPYAQTTRKPPSFIFSTVTQMKTE